MSYFFHSQAQRRTGGTGLGMFALSKRLESLEGGCGVKNREDGSHGSCFWITVPFLPAVSSDDVPDCPAVCSVAAREADTHTPTVTATASTTKTKTEESVDIGGGNDASSDIESSFTLPQVENSSSNLNTRAPPGRLNSKTFSLPPSPLKILLVDDSPLIRKSTSRALSKQGHEVAVAQHGAECLIALETSRFDLILMDLQMPVMDGLEATKRIRELERKFSEENEEKSDGNGDGNKTGVSTTPSSLGIGLHGSIIIIGVTANTAGDAYSDCMSSGMDGFIEKPLKIKLLGDFISNRSKSL